MRTDEEIMLLMLKDADKSMLHVEKWNKYGCTSESDAAAYIEALLMARSIRALHTPSAELHVRGGRTLHFPESTPYTITDSGKADLQRFLTENK